MKKGQIFQPECHRAVNWNEKAVQAVIDKHGYILAGIKIDGFRVHIGWLAGELQITTRAGIVIKALDNYRDYFAKNWQLWKLAPDVWLDGEVWLPGVPFDEQSGHLRRHEPLAEELKPQFIIFDLMNLRQLDRTTDFGPHHGEFGNSAFTIRNAAVMQRWPYCFGTDRAMNKPIVSESLSRITSIEQAVEVFRTSRKLLFEGLVFKDPSCPIRNGKVAGQWKMKPGCGAPGWEGDGIITGYVWGEEGKANEGKLVGFRVKLEDGGESNATGLTQQLIALYTEDVRRYCGGDITQEPFIGRYAQIEAMEKTASGSLRHPKFVAFRDLDYAAGIKA